MLNHTQAELIELGRQARLRRGEPEDGAEATDAEVRRFVRQFSRKGPDHRG